MFPVCPELRSGQRGAIKLRKKRDQPTRVKSGKVKMKNEKKNAAEKILEGYSGEEFEQHGKVIEAIGRAQRALNGESNDEEHDALFELVEAHTGFTSAFPCA